MTNTEVIEKYKTDKKYRIETFYWIVNKKGEKVPLILNPPQIKYITSKSRKKLILKSRKEGFSTCIEADWLDDCLSMQNRKCVTMAHTLDDVKIHMDRVKYFIDTMGSKDQKIEIKIDTETQKELYFPDMNSYYWVGTAGSRSFGRGRDITNLHCSEVPHWEDQSVMTAVMEACVPDAKIVWESTGNGIGEMFNVTWEESQDPKNDTGWECLFCAWFDDPTNRLACPKDFIFPVVYCGKTQIDFRKLQKIFNLDDDQIYWYYRKYKDSADKGLFLQEHPSAWREAFIASGNNIFNIERLDEMLKNVREPLYVGELVDDKQTIKFVPNQYGNLTIWKLPKFNRSYLIAGDTAEGVEGGAFNVGTVYDRGTWEIVAQLRLRCDAFLFGKMLDTLGEFYNWSILAPELNNTGHSTLSALKELEYPHIFNMQTISPDMPDKLGFVTGGIGGMNTKEMIISAVRNAVDDGSYKENCPVAIREMMRAVRNEQGKMVSQGSKNERLNLDCVITRGIGLYLLKFLNVDESYRNAQPNSANIIHSLHRKEREVRRVSRTGYR